MDNSKRLQALEDSELETVNGGVGNTSEVVTVNLSSLSGEEISYCLMGFCPKCKKSLTKMNKNFGCNQCMRVYIE